MPAYLISVKYPGNLLKYADTALRIFRMPVSVLFIAMVGFYLLLTLFGVNPWLSVTGSIAYGFSSFFFLILAAGHNTQAIALAYMAPVIGGIYYAYRKNALKGALLTGFMLSLEILANHLQITYYGVLCLMVFFIVELFRSVREKSFPKFLKTTLVLIIPFVIAIGVNFGNLYNIYEYGKYSTGGKSNLVTENRDASKGLDRDYITYWSYGIDETMNLLIPDFKGGSSTPFSRDSETVKALRQNNAAAYSSQIMKYWGTQPGTDVPHYAGAIVIFLFVLGLVIVKGPEKWWLLIATVLSLMLAWGKNFMPLTNLFIDYFPGYNKFRAVTMALVISQFCIPLLGILALRDFYSGGLSKKEMLKGIKVAGGITGGILLLVLLVPGIAGSFLSPYESSGFPEWLKTAMVDDRKSLLRSDAFRSLALILLAAGTILGFTYGKIKKDHSVLILGVLILFDLWSVDKRYLNSDRFEQQSAVRKSFTPAAADAIILKDTSYYRVLNLSVSTFNDNSPTSYFHKSIGGYHGAKLERYQELIDSCIYPELALFSKAADSAKTAGELLHVFDYTPALNMLNAKYLIYNPDAPPLVNPHAIGNAWFVQRPVFVNNANQELADVNLIDPSYEAAIDQRFRDLIKSDSFPVARGDTIMLLSYQPNQLIYSYTAQGERLAVFSEIYYPAGWECYIDNQRTIYFRADYVLRAMIVPEGTHEIRFVFKPESYYAGNKVSLASSLILLLLTAGYFALRLFRKNTG